MKNIDLKEWDSQRESIAKLYSQFLSTYGISYKSLNWGSEYSTIIRYKVLSEIANLESHSILDIGCGLGGLYNYLREHYENFKYKGIDITPNMITQCQNLYPNTQFEVKDILGDSKQDNADYVMASGIFTYLGVEPIHQFYALVEQMYRLANKGVAFNVLCLNKDSKNNDEFSILPSQIIDTLLKICSRIQIRNDYIPHDLTIYMYK